MPTKLGATMTDNQIAQFILHRAKRIGLLLKLTDPCLVIYCFNGSDSILAIKFNGYSEPFMLRFMSNSRRKLFMLDTDGIEPKTWKKSMLVDSYSRYIRYDIETAPKSLKKYISNAVIEALKTKGVGFDLFALSFRDDPILIDPNETYEEAAIETDLMDFELDS